MAKPIGKASALLQQAPRQSKPVESEERFAAYIPPSRLMKKLVRRAKADNGDETVTMSLRTFEKLLESALENFFSGDACLEKYTDIRDAAKRGKIASPLQHFVTDGYFEGRMAMNYNVDEDWYLLPWPLPKIALRLQAADFR